MQFPNLIWLAVALTLVDGEDIPASGLKRKDVDCESESLTSYPVSTLSTYSLSSAGPILSSSSSSGYPISSVTLSETTSSASLSASSSTGAATGSAGSSGGISSLSSTGIWTNSSNAGSTSFSVTIPGTASISLSSGTASGPIQSSTSAASATGTSSFVTTVTSLITASTTFTVAGNSSVSAGTGTASLSATSAPFPSNASTTIFGSTGVTGPITSVIIPSVTTSSLPGFTFTMTRVCNPDNCLYPLEAPIPGRQTSATLFCSTYTHGVIYPVPTWVPQECNADRIFSACSCLDLLRSTSATATSFAGSSSSEPTVITLTSTSFSISEVTEVSTVSSTSTATLNPTTLVTTITAGRLPPVPLSSPSFMIEEQLSYSSPSQVSSQRSQDPQPTNSFDALLEEIERLEDLFEELVGTQSELAEEILHDLEKLLGNIHERKYNKRPIVDTEDP